MFGASLLKVVKFLKDGSGLTASQGGLIVFGMLVAFVVSILAIRFLLSYIRKHDFKVFGVYRIVLGVVVLLFFAISSMF